MDSVHGDKKLKILMVPTLVPPVVYYRMEQTIKYLRRQGHEVAFSYRGPKHQKSAVWQHRMPKEFVSTVENLIQDADVAVFQMVHTQWAVALILALRDVYKKPILIDVDDDPYSLPPEAHSDLMPGKLYEVWMDDGIKAADGLLVSTPYLMEHLKKRHPDKPMHLVPNGIDFENYDDLKPRKAKTPLAGWTGGAGHQLDLRLLEDVVRAMPDANFAFYNGNFPNKHLRGRNVKQVHMTMQPEGVQKMKGKMWWRTMHQYPKFLAGRGLWCGLAPLVDNEHNRAKSNLRWLEYSALGLPTVASPVEPFKCILDGKTGFLAHDTEGWITALRTLFEDGGLRREMGDLARKEVRDHFNVEHITRDYADILRGYV